MKTSLVMLMAAVMLVAAGAAAQSIKVGVVNLARIEKDSAAAKRANNALVAEFEPRNKQIQEFQKKISAAQARLKAAGEKLSQAEQQAQGREIASMMRQSDQMLRALTEELELRKRELGIKMIEEARAAIKSVAEAGKFDLVVSDAVFVRPGIDITDQVLKEMAKRGR